MPKIKLSAGIITWFVVLGIAAIVPVFYIGLRTRRWTAYQTRRPFSRNGTLSANLTTSSADPINSDSSTKLNQPFSAIPRSPSKSIEIDPPNTEFRQFTVEDTDACLSWTYKRYILPNNDLHVEYTIDQQTGVARAKWDGLFSTPVDMAHGIDCFVGRPATAEELLQQVNAQSFLCTFDTSNKDTKYTEENPPERPKKTLVLDFDPELYHWNDIVLNDSSGSLNIWHFHAQFFPMWLSMRLADVSIKLLETQNFTNVLQPNTLEPPTDVIMLFPPDAWSRFNLSDTENGTFHPFLVTAEKLFELRDKYRGQDAPLAGLQAVNDGLEGKLLIGNHNSTTGQLFQAMREANMETRASVWLRPPGREGYLWLLERKDLIKHNYGNCHNSMINDYVKPFLEAVPIKYPPPIAKHVCFISRQMRANPKVSNPKIKSRNLTPEFFASLMQRISAPIVISPHIALRDDSTDGIPMHLDQSSLTGQMRFIHHECALLVGVHGAGLGHVFAMKPGSHLIEFQNHKEYWIFKNSALLLNNVTYSQFLMNSTLLNPSNFHECDFYVNDTRLDELVTLIQDKLEESIIRQTKLLAEKPNR